MAMERRLGPLAQPYHEGDALRYRRLSRVLTAVRGRTGRRRRAPLAGGRRGRSGSWRSGGSAARRWSVFKAGIGSALDPAYTVGPQRERLEERDGAG